MYAHVTAWGWFWSAWLGTGVSVEVYWLLVNASNTLSRQIWGVEHLDLAHPLEFSEWTWVHWTLTGLLWTTFLWLCLHFPFGWLR